MSNKSGISSQVLPLPQGGGALQGIGETFSPDLFTGTGNLTVPLAPPGGRGGFQPSLSLVYSTGGGNGPFGLGWSVTVPEIFRQGSHGLPRYDGAGGDTFALAGAGELVRLDGPAGEHFRPRVEGLFARIEHLASGGPDRWRVRAREGTVNFYGAGSDPAGSDPAVIADPGRPGRIYCWKLCETDDTAGNRIVYGYRRDRGTDGPHAWDQLYLQSVQYVDYTPAGAGGGTRFLVSITFEYAERPDPFSSYVAGFEIRTRLRCKRIVVQTHPDDGDRLVRTVELAYLDERVAAGELPAEQLPPNGVSLLSRIQVIGHDGDRTEALPPLDFGYTRFRLDRRRSLSFSAAGGAPPGPLPGRSLADPDFELVDLFGNGLPCIVQMDGVVQFWRNRGEGRFDRPAAMPEVPAGVQLRDPTVHFADMNGNGRADLLALKLGGYFPLSFGGRWSREGFVRYAQVPSVDLSAPDVRMMDLDGDGVVDALRTGTQFELFFNDPQTGWNRVETRPRGPLAAFPDLNFTDPHVRLARMAGSLQDFVLVGQGRIDYWPYLGFGRWGARVTMQDSPVFPVDPAQPGGFDPGRLILGDVDGDGLDDALYLERNRVTIWINQGGNGWSGPTVITGTPTFDRPDAVRLADMLATGTAGLLWTSDQTAPGQETYRYVDLTGGVKPYVLDEIDNHYGALTRIQYDSSTRFYQADQADPKMRWRTPLPFPLQVVSRVETLDRLSGGKLATEFRYHHGYWDGDERELRGFGMVEQIDTEAFDQFNAPGLHAGETGAGSGAGFAFPAVAAGQFSPPVLTRTWFHLGAVGDEFRDRNEMDFSAQFFAEDPSVLAPAGSTLGGLTGQARADALNALAGSTLRTEVYALDGSPRQDRPYSVTEAQYGVREEEPPGPAASAAAGTRHRIFFPHRVAQRVTQWERGREPMTRFIFNDGYDAYGQAGSELSIAVPRGRDFRQGASAGAPYLATLAVTTYAALDTAQAYLVNRVASSANFEILNDGSLALADLQAAVASGAAPRKVIGATLNYYDGEPFEGLPLGQVAPTGALVRSEVLVLTPEILQAAYGADGIPPYLDQATASAPAWTADYPEAFRGGLLPLAGYRFDPGDAGVVAGYYAPRLRQAYDFQLGGGGHGLVVAQRDPLGGENRLEYDAFALKAVRVTDAAGLVTTAEYDLRTLRPRLVTDPNGNRSTFSFTPLGLVETTAVMGRPGEAAGDVAGTGAIEPSLRLAYDFGAFVARGQPISVRTIRSMHRASEADVPAAERSRTIEAVEYTDGFGRLLQTRTQAESLLFDAVLAPAQGGAGDSEPIAARPSGAAASPGVVVSGWQIYDNKGHVVTRFEPFFATGWDFEPPDPLPAAGETGLFYDPRGQVLRTVQSDGSESRVVLGIPASLSNPDDFEPTPWEAYSYDLDDNAGRTPAADPQASGYAHCWDTPHSAVLDALGRTSVAVARNRAPRATPGDALPPLDEQVTRIQHDIRGNLLGMSDPLGRQVCAYVYDLQNRPLRIETLDAGLQLAVLDAAGNSIEGRDGRGALLLQSYDRSNRLTAAWARDASGEPVTWRERLAYGDDAGTGPAGQDPAAREEQRAHNRLGRLHRHYDEAGLVTYEAYDFQGNVLEKSRRVIRSEAILAVFPPPGDPSPNWDVATFRVDWQPAAGSDLAARGQELLDPQVYTLSAEYNAQSQARRLVYPADVDGRRSVLEPLYNEAGALERVTLDGETVVEQIAYNARGQRTVVLYGSGVMTRYAYDARSFRLARLRSERFSRAGGPDGVLQPAGGVPLQDIAYTCDLAGNLLGMDEIVPAAGASAPLARRFTFDALYRLLSATGRECAAAAGPIPGPDGPRCGAPAGGDPSATQPYREDYAYDRAGNLLQLRHQAAAAAFTRDYRLADGSNRVQELAGGGGTLTYAYDACGSLVSETTSRRFEWDQARRLRAFRVQAGSAEPSVHVHSLYDAEGNRVVKLARKQGGSYELTVAIDQVFERRQQVSASTTQTNDSLHVMDQRNRIAIVRRGPAFAGDGGPAVQYHLGDHTGSSQVVVGGVTLADGDFISREEYTPYGETSFGSFARKRYRFNGQERDEESGLGYHRARHYAPWLCRWISPDPYGFVDGLNTYAFGRNAPTRYSDPGGTSVWDWVKGKAGDVAGWLYGANKAMFATTWDASKQSKDIGFNILETGWEKVSNFADNLWGWAKEHPYLASGAGVVAAAVALVGFHFRETLMNWVVAPAVRIGTNALMGYAVGGMIGGGAAVAGAVIGGLTGAVHGFMMADAKSYNWSAGDSWLAFVADNTWSLFNSFVGSFFATANLGNQVDPQSAGSTMLYFKNGWLGNYATTLGNVTVGADKTSYQHEQTHAVQARLAGPAYFPIYAVGIELATVLPYWKLYKHCANTKGFSGYFVHGVYPNSLWEGIAYAVQDPSHGCP